MGREREWGSKGRVGVREEQGKERKSGPMRGKDREGKSKGSRESEWGPKGKDRAGESEGRKGESSSERRGQSEGRREEEIEREEEEEERRRARGGKVLQRERGGIGSSLARTQDERENEKKESLMGE